MSMNDTDNAEPVAVTPATNPAPVLKRWNAGGPGGRRFSVATHTFISRASKRPSLLLIACGDDAAVWFPCPALPQFLAENAGAKIIVYDLAGMRRQLRAAGEARAWEGLERAVDGQNVVDCRILWRLWGIANDFPRPDEEETLEAVVDKILPAISRDERDRHLLGCIDRREAPPDAECEGIKSTVFRALRLLEATTVLEKSLEALAVGEDIPVERRETYGLATHDLQAKATCVLAEMSEYGVAFDRDRHTQLVSHAWAHLCLELTAFAASYPGISQGAPDMGRRTTLGDLVWKNLVAAAIDCELVACGWEAGSFVKEDLEGRGLTLAAPHSPCARACLTLRERLLAFNLLEPGLRPIGGRVFPTYVPLAATGRANSREPNVQGFSKESGIRECVTAPGGKMLLSLDYKGMELIPLAAECQRLGLGTHVADALRQGLDLHSLLASRILGVDYHEFLAGYEAGTVEYVKARKCAKAVNFGLAAGMGVARLCETVADILGEELTDDDGRGLEAAHQALFPDIATYVERHENLYAAAPEGGFYITLPTGRTRLCPDYTTALNTRSQGLGADVALTALHRLRRAGFRPVVFVHDEIVLEVEETDLRRTLEAARDIMSHAMTGVLGVDIPALVEAEVGASWGRMRPA